MIQGLIRMLVATACLAALAACATNGQAGCTWLPDGSITCDGGVYVPPPPHR